MSNLEHALQTIEIDSQRGNQLWDPGREDRYLRDPKAPGHLVTFWSSHSVTVPIAHRGSPDAPFP